MIDWIQANPRLTGLLVSGAGVLILALWLVKSFLVFLWAKAHQPAFGVELAENATYIRKRNGQLIKIADHRYDEKELKRFRSMAIRAQKEVEEDRESKKNRHHHDSENVSKG